MKLLLVVLLVLCCSTAYAVPTATLSFDKSSVNKTQTLTLSSTVSVPATDTVTYNDLTWKYQLPAQLSVVSATGPLEIANQGTVTWPGTSAAPTTPGTSTSNTVYFTGWGATLTLVPDATRWISIQCGDMKPSDSGLITIVLKFNG